MPRSYHDATTHPGGYGSTGFPDLPREPPTLPELPDDAEPIELARAYASALMAMIAFQRQLVSALDHLHGLALGARAEAETAQRRVTALEERVATYGSMRPPSDSMVDAVTHASVEAAREFSRRQRDDSMPAPDAHDVEAIVAAQVGAIVDREREHRRALEQELRAEAQRETDRVELTLRLERDRDRRRVVWLGATTVAAVVVSVVQALVGAHVFGH